MAQEIAIHDKEARKFFDKTIEKTKKIHGSDRAFVSLLSALIYKDVINHFEEEMGPKGKWQSWSSIYKDHMNRIGKGGNKILQDSGRLRQAFIPTNYRKVGEGILWYNPIEYAAAHDEGTKTLPQREFMWASDDVIEKIEDVTLKFVLDL